MELSEQTLEELSRLIHRLTGLVVGKDKAYLVKHRLEGVAKRHGCPTFEAFVRELKAVGGGRLHEEVIEAITTKETSFFRDHWVFEAIGREIFPEIAAQLARAGELRHGPRIWSAAAATGQEAYSVAILLRELNDQPGGGLCARHGSILASDISTVAINTAKNGSYTTSEVRRGISSERLRRHFKQVGDRWQIDESLQKRVRFRRLDLLHPPADLGRFDLVLCRNILIYFDQETRQRLCRQLFDLIEPGGWLILGAAESLYGIEDRFELIKFGRAVFYRKPQPKDRSSKNQPA